MDAALLRYEQTVLIALEEAENALFGFTSARTRQARLEVAAEASQEAQIWLAYAIGTAPIVF